MKLSTKQIAIFRTKVLGHYKEHKRDFPWRHTNNPYKICLSEVMSQQTQIDRVIPKYNQWINSFPTIQAVSQANLASILELWSGLGYNRRAKYIHQMAKIVHTSHKNKMPETKKGLLELPGIGDYTASAIMVFAYNKPEVVIDTNIRTTFIFHFFNEESYIDDNSIIPLIEQTTDLINPKDWFNALMDYGAMIKKKYGNFSKKSKHYTKQSVFTGSKREVRGQILKHLITSKKEMSINELKHEINSQYFTEVIKSLIHEGLIEKDSNDRIFLPK